MENANTGNLAERIAALLTESEKKGDGFLRAGLEKINERLDKIESDIAALNAPKAISTIESRRTPHFSQEKFANLEEFADEILNSVANEKACPFEPAGKPCDQCAMCNSRGF